MVQPCSSDFIVADSKGVSAADFFELALRVHGRHVHWKIGYGHLRFEHLLQAVAAQKFRTETIKLKLVLFRVQRGEKRNSLNVIPVIVGDKDMRFRRAACSRRISAITQHAQACAAIQNELRAIGRDQFEAGRVSAVTPSGRVHRRRGASYTPETQLGKGSSHQSLRTGLAQLELCAYALNRKLCRCWQRRRRASTKSRWGSVKLRNKVGPLPRNAVRT